MQVTIWIDVTAEKRTAGLTVNPYSQMYSQSTQPAASSVTEAEATNEVLAQAITFAKMINAEN